MPRQITGADTRVVELHNKQWYDCPCTATVMPKSICWVDELTCCGYHIATDELCSNLSMCKGRVMSIIEELGYSKSVLGCHKC
jgi:hypothetical protein